MSVMDVVGSVNDSNLILPAGDVRIGTQDFNIYANSQIDVYKRQGFNGERGGENARSGATGRAFNGDRQAARGYAAPRGQSGVRSGAFSGYQRGGQSRSFSSRGSASMGGGARGGGFGGGGGGHGGGGHR